MLPLSMINSPSNFPMEPLSDHHRVTSTVASIGGFYKNFDFLGQEHYSPHTIKLRGVGNHKGILSIPLAVNPWKNSPNAVKDLRFDQLSRQYIKKQPHQAESSNLHVKSTKISYKNGVFKNLSNSSQVYTLSYDISLWPTYKRAGLDGELLEESFKDGNFKVTLSLMEKIPSTKRYFTISTTEQVISIKNGFLNTPVAFNIQPRNWPGGSSLLEMFIQLSPLKGPDSLGVFQGAVSMKNMVQNNHDTPGRLTPSFNFATMTSQFRPESIKKDDNAEERNDFIFEIDSIQGEHGSLTGKGHNTSSDKTLKSKLHLQLVSPFNKDVIKKTRFLITIFDQDGNPDTGEERIASIDSKGVLKSYALIHYNAYNCSQWLPYKIKIKAIDGQIKGLEKERTILFNPWNPSDFFYDSVHRKPPENSNCTPPSVHIADIKYSNDELDRENFLMDNYLNLSIRKFYKINFKPLLKITSSYQKETTPQTITYGKFILRLDLYSPKKAQVNYQNPDLTNFKYVTSAEQKVSVEEGVINAKMGMPFYIEESVVLSYKNIIVITLTPVDEPFLRGTTRFFFFLYLGTQSKIPHPAISQLSFE